MYSLLVLVVACGAPARHTETQDAPAPPITPLPVVRAPEPEPPEPARAPAPWAIASLEGREYTCTLGAWLPAKRFPSAGGVEKGFTARIQRQGTPDQGGSATVSWRIADGAGAFATTRTAVAWPPRAGARPDTAVTVRALVATNGGLLVREDAADLPVRLLWVPRSGDPVEIARPTQDPFDVAAVLALEDEGFAVQWAASLRDVVTLFRPDGSVRANSDFRWQVEGHGVIRGLGRNRGNVGLVVEDPAAGTLELQIVGVLNAQSPRVALPRPMTLAPCTDERSNDDIQVVDRALTLLVSPGEVLGTHATIVEVGARGSCLREVGSLPSAEGNERSASLIAVDGRALEGSEWDGARRRPLTCVPVGSAAPAAAGPSASACANVHIGLDLRALPRGSSPGGINLFVGGQADDFVAAAGPGPAPEIRSQSGVGGFEATFRGATSAEVMARCQSTVRAYMASAPRLPIIMDPAASITERCRPCP